jgi:hypothetical protein
LAGVGVQAGGDIDRQDRNAATVDRIDQFAPILIEGAIEANAKKRIDDPSHFVEALRLETLRKLSQTLPRFIDVGHKNVAIRQMGLGGARVIAVMAFAGDDPDRVAGPGQFENTLRQEPANLLDDLLLGLAERPKWPFPTGASARLK